jgi:hypothetical protein
MINLLKSTVLLCLLLLIVSCDRPQCKNTNQLFDKYSPDSKEYKEELIKQLKLIENSELSYWFKEYKLENEKEYIYVFIQGRNLCAVGELTVKQWGNLGSIQRTKGMGYQGAQLTNLKFDIYQDSSKTELIYKSHGMILD